MQVATSMFTPIDAADGGYYGVRAGDYPPGVYAVYDNAFGLPVEMAIPAFATGCIVQAITDLTFYTDQESAASASLPMQIAAGSIMRFQGADAVRKLCFVIGASTSFVLQYTQGEGGVPPAFFLVSGGGVTPPPPPGSAAVWTINELHVMEDDGSGNGGNDATGAPNRLDLPYRTIAAAEAAAIALGTPCAIHIYKGTYTGANMGVDRCTYIRHGCTIEDDGANYIFTTTGLSVGFDVTGSGEIIARNGGKGVLHQNASGTTINWEGSVYGSDHTDILVHQSVPGCVLNLDGDITSEVYAALRTEGVCVVRDDVEGGPNYPAAECANGRQIVQGRATAAGNGTGALASGGIQEVHGEISSERIGAECGAAVQRLYNRTVSYSFYGVYTSAASADLIAYGPVHSDGHYGALCLTGKMSVYGPVTSLAVGNAAVECNDGQCSIYGDVTASGGIGANMNGTGSLIVYGNATSTDGPGAKCAAGKLTVYGTTTSDTSYAWFATGGESNIEGPIISASNVALYVQFSPAVRVRNRVTSTTNGITIATLTADVQLYANCYIDSGAESVLGDVGTPVPLRSYGATGNSATSDCAITGTFYVVP